MNSYQKIKKQNIELQSELIILSTEPYSIKAIEIKMKWKLIHDIEKAVWQGSVTNA